MGREEITDPDLRRTVRRAIEARNRLVSYSVPDAEVPLISDVLKACAALLAQESHEPEAESLRQPLSATLRSCVAADDGAVPARGRARRRGVTDESEDQTGMGARARGCRSDGSVPADADGGRIGRPALPPLAQAGASR